MAKGIIDILMMIPKGGKYAKSVVNFIHKAPKSWSELKQGIKQIEGYLKKGRLRLDGKQKTIFETNKNILKNHEKVTKETKKREWWEDIPEEEKGPWDTPPKPFWENIKKEDMFKGWTPTLVERSKLRNIYKDLDPPKAKYTKEMEAIDEELDALAFGGDKYEHLSVAAKNKIMKKLQAEMEQLIAKGEDLTTLSLSQINKRTQNIQKKIREIADNPNIKGTVTEGPKRDMIEAISKSERKGLEDARDVIKLKNAKKKYGDKFPRLDPDNDAFIITGLDEVGSPIKVGRFTGRFSAERHPITADLTRKEGTAWLDKWDPKKNKMREEGKEVWHETVDSEGKVIMSNPDYKVTTKNMDIWNNLNLEEVSISELAKKGFKLKDIDMLVKARAAKKYVDTQEAAGVQMHERTYSSSISDIMEDLYLRGDDVYKMSIQEWTKKIPEHFAEGGRTGFHRGSLRHQKTHDYRAYEKSGDWLKQSPPDNWLMTLLGKEKMGAVVPERDAFESYMKERFMYGEQDSPPNVFKQIWLDIQKLLGEKRNEHATGGISNLFQERQGYRSGKAVELVTKLPEFLKFVERLLIKASNEIRRGQGKWKDLNTAQKVAQHDNLTKMVTEFQKTKKFDSKMNEYFGIDAEKAFIEAQAKVKTKKKEFFSDKDAAKEWDYEIKKAVEGMDERTLIKTKYPGISDDLLNKILIDDNPQRKAEVLATMDEYLKLREIGKGDMEAYDIIVNSFKKKPTKHATGGLIPGYNTGGVSNLFRSR